MSKFGNENGTFSFCSKEIYGWLTEFGAAGLWTCGVEHPSDTGIKVWFLWWKTKSIHLSSPMILEKGGIEDDSSFSRQVCVWNLKELIQTWAYNSTYQAG